MAPLNSVVVRSAKFAGQALALAVFSIGSLSFLGWILDNEFLKSPAQDGITIKANASLGLMLVGAALWLLRLPAPKRTLSRNLGRFCAAVAMTLGTLTLLQHLTGIDFGIDQLLFHEPPGAAATASPGRMGRPASFCLMAGGLALWLLDARSVRLRMLSQALGALICVITITPLIGYAYGVSQLYSLGGYTGIAFHTAIALLAFGGGLLLVRPDEGLPAIVCADDVGGLMARRLIPIGFLLPIVTWWFSIRAEINEWIEAPLVRPVGVLFLSVCSVLAILWNARRMSQLEQSRRQTERERRKGYQHTVQILESVSDAFYAIDAAGRFTYVNRQAEELWGRSRDSLLQKSLGEEFPEIAENERAAHRDVLRTRAPRRYETFSPRLKRWFDVSLYPEANGGVSGFFRDITERRETVEELRRARDLAETANRTKSEFIATLSHELRTPLNPVVLTLEYLEGHREFPAALRGELASIRRHVDLEIQLISDLLDLTRIESGKLQLALNDVDLHEAIREVVVTCRRKDGPEITLELKAEKTVVRADPVRLHQILWNLLSNAQKFTDPAGRVTLRTGNPRGEIVRLEVEDNGAGIAPELMSRLFNAFEQGETRSTRQRGGLGLGLTITRKIVEAHQGIIRAVSDGVGRGSRFEVELPARSKVASIKREALPAAVPHPEKSLAVLLVEDHVPTLQAMARLLEMMGHQAETAGTTAEAEAIAARRNFDLLISDIGLPDESGLELMRRLRPKFSGRAIALTGYGTENDVREALDAGFTEHLTKPVQVALLKAALGRIASPAKMSL